MTYLPNPTVRIAGIDYTGDTVDTVNIRRGRDTVYGAPSAGFGSVTLLNADGLREPVVGDPVRIRIDNSDGQPTPLFTGFISDWSSEALTLGGTILVRYQVQVVGLLARLVRRTVLDTGAPEQLDGARVLAAINAAFPVSWEEFQSSTTWAEVDGETTWATVDPGFDPDRIDPGVFTLTALAPNESGRNALTVASQAGESAKGLLFETRDGFVAYADADRRPANAGTGFLTIPFGVLQVGGFNVTSSLSDLTNRVTVEFGDDESVELSDTFSIGEFGLQQRTLTTQLLNETNALTRADDFLFSHSAPVRELQAITINLRANIPDALIDALTELNSNDAIQIVGAPSSILPGGFRGFVEGVTWRISDFEATITIFASNVNLSFGTVLWGQVDATITWQTVDQTLPWADARRVTT